MKIAATFIALAAFCAPAGAYTVYVSNEKGNTISVIDGTTLEVTKTVKVGQRPRGITVTKDGKFILVCVSDDDTIVVVDAATFEIVGQLPSGPDPELFVLDPTGNPLYVCAKIFRCPGNRRIGVCFDHEFCGGAC